MLPAFTDIILDDGDAALKTMLLAQPLVDALGRVPLLPRPSLVLFQDRIDEAGLGAELRPPYWLAAPIARWNRVPQNLVDCLAINAKTPGRFPLAQTLMMAGKPNLPVKIHLIHLPRLANQFS